MSGNQAVLIPAGGDLRLSCYRAFDTPPVKVKSFWAQPLFVQMWLKSYPGELEAEILAAEKALEGLTGLRGLRPPYRIPLDGLDAAIEMAHGELVRLQARRILMQSGYALQVYQKLETFAGAYGR